MPHTLVHLSIVIPAYNERERLPESLRRILEYVAAWAGGVEIIVCDDGSRDGTSEVAKSILSGGTGTAWRVLRSEENRGKGHAVRTGMMAARGELLLFSDADLSTPVEEAERLAAAIRDGADVPIGSRGRPDSKIIERQPFYREGMGRIFNLLLRTLVLPGVCDSQCGFKMFRQEAARMIFSRATVNGWAFDVEALILARRLGCRLCEVPVRWQNSPASKVSLLRGSLSMLYELGAIRWRYGREGFRRSGRRGSAKSLDPRRPAP